jgi:hypothetical protein
MKASAWGEQMLEHLIEHLFWGFAGGMNRSWRLMKTRMKKILLLRVWV